MSACISSYAAVLVYLGAKTTRDYAYVQVAMTIMNSRETEDREYRPLEQIADNYPKFVMTRSDMIQKRNGIRHINLPEFIQTQGSFT